MPKLLEEREIKLEWGDIDALVVKERTSSMRRSSGVHLSGVIRYVMTVAGQLTQEDREEFLPLRMAVGMAWEAFVVGLWPDMIWQPGECSRDGIVGSPDGITRIPAGEFPPRDMMLEEFKATWKSRLEKTEQKGVRPPAKKITEDRLWMLQVGGYCHMMGLNKARMHVLWVNGDYRGSGPQYFTYLIQFGDAELERMWNNMILPNIGGATPEVH